MPPTDSLDRLDPADLRYAVRQLIADRKVTAEKVLTLARQRSGRIAELQRLLSHLRAGQAEKGARRGSARAAARRPKKVSRPKKRKFTMTPKARAARKLQGQYLGMLRTITGAKRAKVKAVAKKDGVAAAVKLAAKLGD